MRDRYTITLSPEAYDFFTRVNGQPFAVPMDARLIKYERPQDIKVDPLPAPVLNLIPPCKD